MYGALGACESHTLSSGMERTSKTYYENVMRDFNVALITITVNTVQRKGTLVQQRCTDLFVSV